MSASLVGSEMCIRDRVKRTLTPGLGSPTPTPSRPPASPQQVPSCICPVRFGPRWPAGRARSRRGRRAGPGLT
eukprot:15199150-Alexandrium_andersonii.AAC.1